jgi:hypothetical protein
MNSSFIIEKNSWKYDVWFYYWETKMKNYDYKAEYSETISAQLWNDWKYTKLEWWFMILTYSYFQFPNIKEWLISYQYAIPTTINESNITWYFDFSDELSTYNSWYYAENYKVELLK